MRSRLPPGRKYAQATPDTFAKEIKADPTCHYCLARVNVLTNLRKQHLSEGVCQKMDENGGMYYIIMCNFIYQQKLSVGVLASSVDPPIE